MPPSGLHPAWHAFHLPKRGNAAEEYEDAFAADPATGRFSVADGASESSFAASWARLLVEGFVGVVGKPWQNLDWLHPLRQRWANEVDGLSLPWYAEAKREEGAFATLLGLAIRPPRERRGVSPPVPGVWRALAVGDCCLFRTRAGRLLQAFPVTASADFDNRPRLLGSRASHPSSLPPPRSGEGEQKANPVLPPLSASGRGQRRGVEPALARGRWRTGDRFLLMTDALAQWFLRQSEQGGRPLAEIAALLAESAPRDAFTGWIDERRQRDLRNDDVTLAVIDL